jgi:hypothetical protein
MTWLWYGVGWLVMAWVFDGFNKHKGFSTAVVTGKVRLCCFGAG